MTRTSYFASAVLGLILSLGAANAAEPLTLLADQSQILTMARSPGTVVVGNPSIADVTIQGQRVFLHGRTFGTTNITILDEAGAQLAMFEVTVQQGGSNDVTMFRAGMRGSYVCAPDCASVLQVGDDQDYFKLLASQTNSKIGIAMGQKSGESTAPAPTPSQ